MTTESSYHSANPEIQTLTEQSKTYAKQIMTIVDEVQKVIVGQEEVIKKLVIAMMADGHVLLEGVPGLAKTK
ncbi:ATPase, partial [bacterium]|nr:ATPase [bacterium]